MCLLAIFYQTIPAAPLAVAANREEFFDRPFLSPHVLGDHPRFLAGRDARAGGTWLGVNEHGLLVAVTNRPKTVLPEQPRSRGLLCCDLLAHRQAGDAIEHALDELATGHYAGANFVVADLRRGAIVESGDTLSRTSLTPGLHLVTNGPANDPQDSRQALAREMFASGEVADVPSFLAMARLVCRRGPEESDGRTIVVRQAERGTVSSTLLTLGARSEDTTYAFAPGAPDVTPYEDYSRELRELVHRGESKRDALSKRKP